MVLMVCIKVWEGIYTPNKILAKVRRELGIAPRDNEVSLSTVFKKEMRSESLHVSYRITLPKQAASLTLVPEGAQSGRRARVAGEVPIEDEDFNAYFWVESAPVAWLTEDRRALLIDLFEKHRPSAVTQGRLEGEIRCDRAPWTSGTVARKVREIRAVVRALADPSPRAKVRPRGWVSARQRILVALAFLAVGALALLSGGSTLYVLKTFPASHPYLMALSLLYALSGLALIACGLAVFAGHRKTLMLGRLCQGMSTVTLFLSIPLGMYMAKPIPSTLVFMAGFGAASTWLAGSYDALTRLPLRTDRRASEHRLG